MTQHNHRQQPHAHHFAGNQHNRPDAGRREYLLRRQEELADELDELLAWEQALVANGQTLQQAEQRLAGQKGITTLSVLLAGGRSSLVQNYHYEQRRLLQEHSQLQQEWNRCQAQKAAVQRKIERVIFELSLC